MSSRATSAHQLTLTLGSRAYALLAPNTTRRVSLTHFEAEEVDEDNMEEIDPDNIIQDGRRTRGKTIDFTKANEDAGLEDYDEDDDEDFEDPDDSMQQ